MDERQCPKHRDDGGIRSSSCCLLLKYTSAGQGLIHIGGKIHSCGTEEVRGLANCFTTALYSYATRAPEVPSEPVVKTGMAGPHNPPTLARHKLYPLTCTHARSVADSTPLYFLELASPSSNTQSNPPSGTPASAMMSCRQWGTSASPRKAAARSPRFLAASTSESAAHTCVTGSVVAGSWRRMNRISAAIGGEHGDICGSHCEAPDADWREAPRSSQPVNQPALASTANQHL